MIYRILIDEIYDYTVITSEAFSEPDRCVELRSMSGASQGFYCEIMNENNLKAPDFQNARCRFFFTEEGWDRVGRKIAAEATRQGRVVKIVRKKNPRRSEIFFRDALQVALLPPSRHTSR